MSPTASFRCSGHEQGVRLGLGTFYTHVHLGDRGLGSAEGGRPRTSHMMRAVIIMVWT